MMPKTARSWMLPFLLMGLVACGGDLGGDAPPAGSCKTGGSATGSYSSMCNQCAQAKCNKELTEKAGSGWAMQYFGGNGACAAFNACVCQCLTSGMNPLQCGTTACIAKLDQPCQSALTAAQDCLARQCSDSCR